MRNPAIIAAGGALSLALLGGGTVWYLSQPSGPEAAFMAMCADLPDAAGITSEMRAHGWQDLPDARLSELADAAGLFHVASRHASASQAFDAEQERAVFVSRRDDALELAKAPGSLAFGRETDAAMALVAPIEGIPNAWNCDLYLPDGVPDDWYQDLVDDHQKSGNSFGWASALITAGQLPRPGLWVANWVQITPDAQSPSYKALIDTIGFEPDLRQFSRNAFRGELVP